MPMLKSLLATLLLILPLTLAAQAAKPAATARPAALWPPPRTDTVSPCARANRTQATTSAVSAHRATAAGCLSIIPL